MNRFERRKAESLERKVRAMKAREVAIQARMDLHDALAEKRKQELRSMLEKKLASEYDELYKKMSGEQAKRFAEKIAEAEKVSEEQAKRFAEKIAEAERKASEYVSDLVSLRRAYLTTYLGWFAEGGSPESQGLVTSMEAIETAAYEFKNRLTILENRVEKDARLFQYPELLYGALRWLATTYHGAKTGASCPDLDESCRRASGFWYTPHQSDITMGQYASDYEVNWRGQVVKLREHVGLGTSRDPRHTMRIAFLFDKTKRVIVGYIGRHQQTRAT